MPRGSEANLQVWSMLLFPVCKENNLFKVQKNIKIQEAHYNGEISPPSRQK